MRPCGVGAMAAVCGIHVPGVLWADTTTQLYQFFSDVKIDFYVGTIAPEDAPKISDHYPLFTTFVFSFFVWAGDCVFGSGGIGLFVYVIFQAALSACAFGLIAEYLHPKLSFGKASFVVSVAFFGLSYLPVFVRFCCERHPFRSAFHAFRPDILGGGKNAGALLFQSETSRCLPCGFHPHGAFQEVGHIRAHILHAGCGRVLSSPLGGVRRERSCVRVCGVRRHAHGVASHLRCRFRRFQGDVFRPVPADRVLRARAWCRCDYARAGNY